MDRFSFVCKRCNHCWIPRKKKYARCICKPLTCPKCRNRYWASERKIKKKDDVIEPLDIGECQQMEGLKT